MPLQLMKALACRQQGSYMYSKLHSKKQYEAALFCKEALWLPLRRWKGGMTQEHCCMLGTCSVPAIQIPAGGCPAGPA